MTAHSDRRRVRRQPSDVSPDPLLWDGPHRLADVLLGHAPRPAWKPGIYVCTVHSWSDAPSADVSPLYVGKSETLLRRVSEFVMCAVGWWHLGRVGYRESWYTHPAGQCVTEWCQVHGRRPEDLWIAWASGVKCLACQEGAWFLALDRPVLNYYTPATCAGHPRRAAALARALRTP